MGNAKIFHIQLPKFYKARWETTTTSNTGWIRIEKLLLLSGIGRAETLEGCRWVMKPTEPPVLGAWKTR